MNNLGARALAILNILKSLNYPISSLALSKEIGCSTKTIQSEIKNINKQCKNIKIKSIRGIGYKLEGQIDLYEEKNILGNIDRIDFIIEKMLNLNVSKEKNIKLEEMANAMFVSVSSVKNDLKEVKEILAKYNVKVISKHKNGLGVEANEDDVIRCILDLCYKKDNGLILDKFLSEEIINKRNNLKKEILFILKNQNLILSDIEFKNLCNTIFLKLSRKKYKDYKVFINKYISDYKIKHDEIINDKISKQKIIEAINSFCKNLKLAASIDISNDEIFKECLCNHINNLIKNKKLGIPSYRVENINIKNKYPYAYELAKIAKKIIENELDLEIGNDELASIAVHVGGAIERHSTDKKVKKFKVIIVCASGVGTSMLINAKIQEIFKDKIEVIKIIPSYLVEYINPLEVDFIISTMDLDYDKVPIINISPLVTHKEIKIIEKFMEDGHIYKDVLIKNLFDRDLYFINLNLDNKEDILNFMSDELLNREIIDLEMKNSYFEREKIATTEIGNMVAMPHGIKGKIKENKIAVAILKDPIQWDHGKVKLVIMLALDSENILDYEEVFSNIYNKLDTTSKVVNICKNKSYEKFISLFR